MKKFNTIGSKVVPLDRSNVDTDAIIPKQFLKSVKRTGFGPNLFDDWRYLDEGGPDIENQGRRLNPDFVLNEPAYQGAKVLLTRDNFGCGSSREHAVWALDDYGIRVVIAPSFADIFYSNCFKNGVLPVVLDVAVVEQMFNAGASDRVLEVRVDLPSQTVTYDDRICHFEIDPFRKHCMLDGLDDIELSLQHMDDIRAYENKQRVITPWLFS